MTLAYWGFNSCTPVFEKQDYELIEKEMTTAQKQSCMFVGIDVHKDTHTAVGISPYGEKMFEITVGNYKEDFENLTNKVEEMKGILSPYIGLEDVRGYGERLAGYLYEKYPLVPCFKCAGRQTEAKRNTSREK